MEQVECEAAAATDGKKEARFENRNREKPTYPSVPPSLYQGFVEESAVNEQHSQLSI